jgi:hypothetical protein
MKKGKQMHAKNGSGRITTIAFIDEHAVVLKQDIKKTMKDNLDCRICGNKRFERHVKEDR